MTAYMPVWILNLGDVFCDLLRACLDPAQTFVFLYLDFCLFVDIQMKRDTRQRFVPNWSGSR